MLSHRLLSASLLLTSGIFACTLPAQDAPASHRGRKYKVPPETSHIEVEVLRSGTRRPIPNAAVVFHSVKDEKDEGNLEVKTNEEGKAVIDIIPTGSKVDVQVIADGFATFADSYQVNEPTRTIEIKMLKPRAQVSTYTDNTGGASDVRPGIQEPPKPHPPAVVQPAQPTSHTSDPTPQAPVDPNATPGNSQNRTPKVQ